MVNRVTTNWFVFTGAPCSGKTTVIEILRRKGYSVVSDEARVIFEELAREGAPRGRVDTANSAFQSSLLKRKISKIASLDPLALSLHDYGPICSLAWCEVFGIELAADLKAQAQRFRYRGVFLFDTLPLEHDGLRCESDEFRAVIYESLFRYYARLGYSPFRVVSHGSDRASSIAARAEFVERRLCETLANVTMNAL